MEYLMEKRLPMKQVECLLNRLGTRCLQFIVGDEITFWALPTGIYGEMNHEMMAARD
jgi:hypothetical protein